MPAEIANRRAILIGIALAVSTLLVGLLALKTEWSALTAAASNLTVQEFAGYLLAYVALGLLRTMRYDLMLRTSVGTVRLLPVTWVHNMLTQTLPLRSGELSYPLLVKRFIGQSGSMALGALIVVRLLEVMLVMLFGFVAALFVFKADTVEAAWLPWAAAAGLGATLLLLWYSPPLVRLATGIVRFALAFLELERLPIFHRLLSGLGYLTEQVAWVIRERRFLYVVGLSVAIHLLNIGAVAFLLTSVLHPNQMSLLTMVAVISLVMATAWFPLTVAGFGVVEGSWTIALTLFANLQVSDAIAFGFTIHSMQLLAAVGCGAIGSLIVAKASHRGKAR